MRVPETGSVLTACMFWIFSRAPVAPRTCLVLIHPESRYKAFSLTVTVDGNEIPLPAQSAALPFDPGEHLVEASAPGWKS